ncbi:MAG: N-formylglutamate amidohydrolase [Silicimonas sp.]|nr:N-formylglutamate amidohydrolase [Silicimonas sp.]
MLPQQILARDDGPAAEVVNPRGRAPICLVCEHASPAIPSSLGLLGLADEDRYSHAVWDPGAGDLARSLSERLDAPLVLGRVSRLVYDCNRPPERDDATPARTELIDIPGNRELSPQHRAARIREVYDAFHRILSETLDGYASPPALVTIHSFTPSWFGATRATEIGLLHDADDRMARAMLANSDNCYRKELNQPYSAVDGVTHLLNRHGTARGLDSVMIEVRNDLLADRQAVARVAASLHPMIAEALTNRADAR